MSRQKTTSRRLVLKSLAVAGLALSARDVLGLVPSSPAFPAEEGGKVVRVPPSHPLVRAAARAAGESELGGKPFALRPDESEAYFGTRKVKFKKEQATNLSHRAMEVEAVSLAIADEASVQSLRDWLAPQMSEAISSRSAFYFIKAGLRGKAGAASEVAFVLGLSANDAETFAFLVRTSRATQALLPYWVLQRSALRGGSPGGVSISSSSPADSDQYECFLDCLSETVSRNPNHGTKVCAACSNSLAALPRTPTPSSPIAAPACAPCAVLAGSVFAACYFVCRS